VAGDDAARRAAALIADQGFRVTEGA